MYVLKTTAIIIKEPSPALNHSASILAMIIPLSRKRISIAPMQAPNTVPIPPNKLTPPITAAAIDSNSNNYPCDCNGASSLNVCIIPAKPAKKPHNIKQNIFTLFVFIPIEEAAFVSPPVAYIQLPTLLL